MTADESRETALMELTVELADKAGIAIGMLSYDDAMRLNRLVSLALMRGYDFAIKNGHESGIREQLMHNMGLTDADIAPEAEPAPPSCPHGVSIWDCDVCVSDTIKSIAAALDWE